MALWNRDEIRVVIRYNFERGLSIDECLQEIKTVLKDNCPHRTTVFRWYREFQRGNFSLEDDSRSGRPSEAVTAENIAAVEKLLQEDRRTTYRQIEETLYIGAPAVHKILHNHLKVRKVCTLWVPHALTEQQRTQRVNWCKKMLQMFQSGTSRDVNSIITGDETWLYYYDMPTKAKNKVWIFEDEATPVQVRKSRSVKKRLIAVFFNNRGVVARIALDTQKTVTATWYTETCLPRVIDMLKKLRPRSRLNTWHFHHDNAPAHRAQITQEYLADIGLKLLEHPPYSPDLAPCDFGLFPLIKDKLKGQRFASDVELLAAWDKACDNLPEEKWQEIFREWFIRMEKCINCDGQYFEKL